LALNITVFGVEVSNGTAKRTAHCHPASDDSLNPRQNRSVKMSDKRWRHRSGCYGGHWRVARIIA